MEFVFRGDSAQPYREASLDEVRREMWEIEAGRSGHQSLMICTQADSGEPVWALTLARWVSDESDGLSGWLVALLEGVERGELVLSADAGRTAVVLRGQSLGKTFAIRRDCVLTPDAVLQAVGMFLASPGPSERLCWLPGEQAYTIV